MQACTACDVTENIVLLGFSLVFSLLQGQGGSETRMDSLLLGFRAVFPTSLSPRKYAKTGFYLKHPPIRKDENDNRKTDDLVYLGVSNGRGGATLVPLSTQERRGEYGSPPIC